MLAPAAGAAGVVGAGVVGAGVMGAGVLGALLLGGRAGMLKIVVCAWASEDDRTAAVSRVRRVMLLLFVTAPDAA
ncbi:hypothetical protein GCM10010844_16160 [Deinococcus radiotolerans]|uniref:Uncharacterized protein n=1 Tax=Deinococcus radiotolerans TaxID=1309407 RepID=A0ABQ2FII9_9DEIO|nr:hypothetical protein GCM10010844_16160 [Deinococcus radiotolerans]